MDLPAEVVQQLGDIQVCQEYNRTPLNSVQAAEASVSDNTLLACLQAVSNSGSLGFCLQLQSAVDDVEQHLQAFLEAGPTTITEQVG